MTTILVADDNEMNRDIMRRQLEALGFVVMLARDGIEAVAHAREHSPDLILMDVQMPGLNGYDATRELRADPETFAIPIVALTGFGEGERPVATAAGCDGLLPKPYDKRELVELIERLTARRHSTLCESS